MGLSKKRPGDQAPNGVRPPSAVDLVPIPSSEPGYGSLFFGLFFDPELEERLRPKDEAAISAEVIALNVDFRSVPLHVEQRKFRP